jgi:hypothetical protein
MQSVCSPKQRSLEPRSARYRAEYGRALISDPQTRRIAEVELQAAIALEPTNVSYRVALAELYKALGFVEGRKVNCKGR